MAITLNPGNAPTGGYKVSLESGSTISVPATNDAGDPLHQILSSALAKNGITNVAVLSVGSDGVKLNGNVFVGMQGRATASVSDPDYVVTPGSTLVVNRPKSNG